MQGRVGRVLVVDDNALNRRLLTSSLEREVTPRPRCEGLVFVDEFEIRGRRSRIKLGRIRDGVRPGCGRAGGR